MNIYIIGHVSPDLDAVSAAYEYAEFLKKAKRYQGSNIVALRAGEVNKETQYVFKKSGAELPELINNVVIDSSDAIILVDHNEVSQRHELIKSEQVVEILDHHKINVDFTSPVRIDVKPLGSTSTLVYEHFEMYGIEPTNETKNLTLFSILSDTQGLKASTTTGYDSEVAHKLAENLGVDLEKVIFDLFKAKSDITGLSAEEIARKDYKIFDFNGKKVFINQVETVEPEKIIAQKDKLLGALEDIKEKDGVTQAYIVITDILKVNSQIMYITDSEKEIVEKAFTAVGNDNIADIGPRMSRKKDIAPAIESALK